MEVEVYICSILHLSYKTLRGPECWPAENVRTENPRRDKLVTLLAVKNVLVSSCKNEKRKQLASGNTQQRLFDSGGENHM
jgi:hypothetical protein